LRSGLRSKVSGNNLDSSTAPKLAQFKNLPQNCSSRNVQNGSLRQSPRVFLYCQYIVLKISTSMRIAITLITCCKFKVNLEHQLLWWLVESISDGKNGVIHQSIYSNHISVTNKRYHFCFYEPWDLNWNVKITIHRYTKITFISLL
jgi:hypothetical protein